MIRKYRYAVINEFINLKELDPDSINTATYEGMKKIIADAENIEGNEKFTLISHSIVRVNESLLLSVLIQKPMKA